MKHACSRAGGTNAGSSKGPGVHRACPRTRLLGAAAPRGGGLVGGQGLMLRVDFREALRWSGASMCWDLRTRSSGCGAGENDGLLSHVGCGGTPERWGMG